MIDSKIIIAAAIGVGLWVMLKQREIDDMPDQETSTLEDVLVTVDPSTYTGADVDEQTMDKNTMAFLDMIAYAEGTGDRYNILFGGGTFDSYADHPRQLFSFTNSRGETLKTSAAGRYQFLARTWDGLRSKLDLPDFGPDSQDLGAIELIRQRGALNDVRAGRLQSAVAKCAPVWASLPGAGYAQPERSLSRLQTAFENSGGTVTA